MNVNETAIVRESSETEIGLGIETEIEIGIEIEIRDITENMKGDHIVKNDILGKSKFQF